jgi:DNA-binding transcriptional LysR family regulator
MDLDPRKLLTLRAVVRAGSISAGARALGWTQPAVSRHVQDLERAAGVPLLLRGNTGVTPTEPGAALLAHADAVAAHLQAAQDELVELRALRRGTVRLACFPSGLAVLVPAALARLTVGGRSGIDVRLMEAEPPDALTLLDEGAVDLAVVFAYGDPDPDPAWRFLAEESIRLVVPRGTTVTGLADLADRDWVAGCSRCRTHLVDTARRAGFEPRIRHETDDYVVVQSIVAQGLAVTLLPDLALAAYRNPAVDVLTVPGLGTRRLLARTRPGAGRVPSIAAVLAALQQPSEATG